MAERKLRVLSLFWGFAVGGVAQYAVKLEGVTELAPIELRTFCVLNPGRHVDNDALQKLRDRIVVKRNGALDIRWLQQLRQLMSEWQPDALLSHGFNCHFLSRFALAVATRRPRVLCSYHGAYHAPTKVRRLLAPLYNGFTDHFLRRHADAVVAVAGHTQSDLQARGVPPDRVKVVYNGLPDVQVAESEVAVLREEWDVPAGALVAGVASRLERVKGIDYALEAVAQLAARWPTLYFVVVGSGIEEASLRARVQTLGVSDRVRFAGYRADMPRCMAAFDIFLLPSLAENHSIGLLEAMRAGRAIVATTVGGNPESIRDGREGHLVPPADSDALERALENLLGDAERRASMGGAARQRFLECFTEARMVQGTADWMMGALVKSTLARG